MLKDLVKKSPLAAPFIYCKSLVARPTSQNDEALILDRLLNYHQIPKTFIEFGFGGWEFNCAPLVDTWDGLLLDGDEYNVKIARIILPSRIKALRQWITLETLSVVEDYARGRDVGILSIDVDGNDYWFLRKLIHIRPALIIAEYNSVFGLRPISVPYDPKFSFNDYPQRTYFGASLTALHHLASTNGYSLVEVGITGVNAFFIRNDLMGPDDRALDPAHSTREKTQYGATAWYGKRSAELWSEIEHLPFVDVTAV